MYGLQQIKEERFKKLEAIRKAGFDPYPSESNLTYSCQEVLSDFKKLSAKKRLVIAGRVRGIREHGGSTFIDIDDSTAKMQIYMKQNEIGENEYVFLLKTIDIGDFLEIGGGLFKTKRGEKTLLGQYYKILAKSLLPLPEKWHGLKDLEIRIRQRYLDLIMNSEVKDLFIKRTRFINAFREYLKKETFMEVETPILENIPGGAEAEPFITRHNSLGIDLYLRISLELHLKRLVIGGFNKVFEIGKVFRNEGMSTEHLQEFTLLELYRAYWDYNQLMDFVEKMYKKIIKDVFGRLEFEYGNAKLNLNKKWPKVKYCDIFKKFTGINLLKTITKENLLNEIKIRKISADIDKTAGKGRIIDQVYKQLVRPRIIGPVFLIDHPIERSPLAKTKGGNPNLVERFQFLLNGMEIDNGFSELNDPIEQRKRFEEQVKLRGDGDKEAQMMDEDFIKALEYGMPPTAGFGVGLDRLFMILSGASSIRETVLFPTMRPQL